MPSGGSPWTCLQAGAALAAAATSVAATAATVATAAATAAVGTAAAIATVPTSIAATTASAIAAAVATACAADASCPSGAAHLVGPLPGEGRGGRERQVLCNKGVRTVQQALRECTRGKAGLVRLLRPRCHARTLKKLQPGLKHL